MMFSVVTGGAGFIGSHIVDALVAQGDHVLVIDDLSTGDRANLAAAERSGQVEFLAADLLADGWQQAIGGADRVFHIAADPDVRGGAASPDAMFRYSVVMTERVLEAMREQQVKNLVFTSTSTVYGEAIVIPTPESYTPMEPISVYGAGKLACEAIISAYCHSFGMKAWIFRFANVIGARSNHGILWDFMHKLKQNPEELEILGDGTQTKSYIEVHACVEAILYVLSHADQTVNTYNIGSEDWIEVTRIADLVVTAMGLTGVTYHYTGGTRGWVGDVPKMQLAVDRLKTLGWTPTINSEESMEVAMQAMLKDQP